MNDLYIKYYLALWACFMIGLAGGYAIKADDTHAKDGFWAGGFVTLAVFTSIVTVVFAIRYALIGANVL